MLVIDNIDIYRSLGSGSTILVNKTSRATKPRAHEHVYSTLRKYSDKYTERLLQPIGI